MSNQIEDQTPEYSLKRARMYFFRAMRLKCPLCGHSPIFTLLTKTRSFYEWFQPLDGCPRCGYAYEREPGYFLIATWGGIYGFGTLFGMFLYVIIVEIIHPDIHWLWQLGIISALSMCFCFLIARHVKALFIAFDRFWDPEKNIRREKNQSE